MSAATKDALARRITNYLHGGGLFNPELAQHEHVRDLLRSCRDELQARFKEQRSPVRSTHTYAVVGVPRYVYDMVARELRSAGYVAHAIDTMSDTIDMHGLGLGILDEPKPLYTTRTYPCGCKAEGPGDVPAYCSVHDQPEQER